MFQSFSELGSVKIVDWVWLFDGKRRNLKVDRAHWMQRLRHNIKHHKLDLQIRNGTHFEKSIGCHGIFMGPCFWQAFHSANVPRLQPCWLGLYTRSLSIFLWLQARLLATLWWDFSILLECPGLMEFFSSSSDTLVSSWVLVLSLWAESFREVGLQRWEYIS